jgi:hypothetical protein
MTCLMLAPVSVRGCTAAACNLCPSANVWLLRPVLQSGRREVGDTTQIGYFTQYPPPVRPDLRIIDYLRCEEGTAQHSTLVAAHAWPAGVSGFLLCAALPTRPAAELFTFGTQCCRAVHIRHAVLPAQHKLLASPITI